MRKLLIFTGSSTPDYTKGVLALQGSLIEKYSIMKTGAQDDCLKISIYTPGHNSGEAMRQVQKQDGVIFYDPLGISRELADKCNSLAVTHPDKLIWYIDNGSSNVFRSIIRRDNNTVLVEEIENPHFLSNKIVEKLFDRAAVSNLSVTGPHHTTDELCSTPAG